jgi:hypothetical protein
MPARKQTKKLAKKPAKKQLPVIKKVHCTAHKGEPCIARALLMDTLLEALAGTVWYHRQDKAERMEFVVSDLALMDVGHVKGHFTLMVDVSRLHSDPDDEPMEIPFHKFFQTFYPAREININDCQA